jgi:hypothetical protein
MVEPVPVTSRSWCVRCCECFSLFCSAIAVLSRVQRHLPIRPDYDYALKSITPVPCDDTSLVRRVHPPDKSDFLVVTFGSGPEEQIRPNL